jgi:16S rRNA (uracil1498-N3)-methyltransferase
MENLFFQPEAMHGVNYLNPDESRHCIKVLRKKMGNPIRLTDGKGTIFEARITQANPTKCFFEITHHAVIPAPNYSLHLGVAPTKNVDRTAWMVEKCVEIGVDRITFIQTKNSERTKINTRRLEKIAVSAMKQALRPFLPAIDGVCLFSDFLQMVKNGQKFIAHISGTNPPHLMDLAEAGGTYSVAIGPEGDFTTDELEMAIANNFKQVSLGVSRLRTESAGLAAVHIISLINRHF